MAKLNNHEIRREKLREVFSQNGFKLINAKEKADEYQNNFGHFIYFYWKQGANIQIAIDPRIEYSKLLKLNGVFLKKTANPHGLRYGTAMSAFPSDFLEFVPQSPSSRVGRLFLIHEEALPIFLREFDSLKIPQSSSDGSSVNNKYSSITNTETNWEKGKNEDELHKNQNEGDYKCEARIGSLCEEVKKVAKQIDLDYLNKPGKDIDAVVKKRVGQGPFRKLLMLLHGSACCLSGVTNSKLLIASHIVPWSESLPEQKTDPENGLLLSVTWDALFDNGFISFDDNGRLLRSRGLEDDTIKRLGIPTDIRLPSHMLTKRRLENLSLHRKRHGFEI